MIPVSSSTLDTSEKIVITDATPNWQKALANGFRRPADLLDYLQLKASNLPYQLDENSPFRMRVTRHLADLIEPGNPHDPILLQVLPRADEMIEHPAFETDPLMEDDYQVLPGLIHKYKNRVLIIAHQACAIHCRYCFRRHFPYSDARLSEAALNAIETYLLQRPHIDEVILSGGDPLSLSDPALQGLLKRFDQLIQVKTLRIHTRTPVALPERITPELLGTLKHLRAQSIFVIHANHPNELHPVLLEKLQTLRAQGTLILNQCVLLKAVNDDSDTQITLCKRLAESGILPYYLHCLDPVQGTSHFDVDEHHAGQIWIQMQKELSGYQLPRLVREIPQRSSKTWVNPSRSF